ncbi:MAG: tRNA uridine-5-carboxymethylaminomethyl(34) synthesis GTPase MnmE [Longimicrobiales bacterium]|nr:tRNA uridine-5-carboxymethylaminomethyl(34) synthesis GTPase MnmE [Longimicrobiales bacterium]
MDTIVAQATPPGMGGLAVVRISGDDADRVLQTLTSDRGTDGSAGTPQTEPGLPEPRRATLMEIVDPDDGRIIDRAVVTRFQGPASYTGEDVVEISCHGGWLTPRLVVEACVRAGAREAEPGEFTRRAYLRGKLDLVQAEAVADLVEARSTALRDAALGQLERGLSRRVSELRERLVRVEALLAHHVDFPEEDDAPVPMDDVVAEAARLREEMAAMLATAPEGELLREGALAVFAGRPNVGKSSLYNALVGEERAIVTEEAGTTRDALEATVQLGGFPFRLVDTAGLRKSEERIEKLGIEVARRYAGGADVVLYCVEAARRVEDEEVEFLQGLQAPVVLVETKVDLLRGGAREAKGEGREADGALQGGTDRSGAGSRVAPRGRPEVVEVGVAARVAVSVESGEGLDRLRKVLPELVYASVVTAGSEVPVLTRRRHARALESAVAEVEAFSRAVAEGLPAEVAATHLRAAEVALEELLGIVSVDDVLDVVFREFCIGK